MREPGPVATPGFPVTGLRYRRPVHDYAGAWSVERDRCHRFVDGTQDGHPEHCPGQPMASGWRRDGQDRWSAIDACAQHRSQLEARPVCAYTLALAHDVTVASMPTGDLRLLRSSTPGSSHKARAGSPASK